WKMRRPEGIHVRGYGSLLGWSPTANSPPSLYFLGERAGTVSLWEVPIRADTQGKEKAVNRFPDTTGVIDAFSLALVTGKADHIALVLGTPAEFRDLYLL